MEFGSVEPVITKTDEVSETNEAYEKLIVAYRIARVNLLITRMQLSRYKSSAKELLTTRIEREKYETLSAELDAMREDRDKYKHLNALVCAERDGLVQKLDTERAEHASELKKSQGRLSKAQEVNRIRMRLLAMTSAELDDECTELKKVINREATDKFAE